MGVSRVSAAPCFSFGSNPPWPVCILMTNRFVSTLSARDSVLATILDETLARTAFLGLPNQIGVTAKLSVAYKKPTFAEQFVVIRTELTEVKGRKAWSKGRIETLKGDVLVEGE